MKKKLLALLLTALLPLSLAHGEKVGLAGDDFIYRWEAPNGQALYFITQEDEPYVHMEDVNFDGVEDVVATAFAGASNFGVSFFVWDGERYIPVQHAGAESLVNYELYQDRGLVLTCSNDGSAGLLHTTCLWRWEDTELKLLRQAVGEQQTTTVWGEDEWTTKTSTRYVTLKVWDHERTSTLPSGAIGPTLLIETTVDSFNEAEVSSALEAEQSVLWKNLP